MTENENNVQQTTEPLTENNAQQEIENKVNETENKLNKLNQTEVENDYLIDNIPYDFTNMMGVLLVTQILIEHIMNLKKEQYIFMKLNVYLKIMKIIV